MSTKNTAATNPIGSQLTHRRTAPEGTVVSNRRRTIKSLAAGPLVAWLALAGGPKPFTSSLPAPLSERLEVSAAAAAGCPSPKNPPFAQYKYAKGTCDGDNVLRGQFRDGNNNHKCAFIVSMIETEFLGARGEAVAYEAKACSTSKWRNFKVNMRDEASNPIVVGFGVFVCDGKVPESTDSSGNRHVDMSRCEQLSALNY